jgi:hypothetical protein
MHLKKKIAIVTYDLNSSAPAFSDSSIISSILKESGYHADIINLWEIPDYQSSLLSEYSGIVIRRHYPGWSNDYLQNSELPVMIVSDPCSKILGIGEKSKISTRAHNTFIINNIKHPILNGYSNTKGLLVAESNCCNPIKNVFQDVEVLITMPGGSPLLAVHQKKPISYFGWTRLSVASHNSIIMRLLISTAKWTFESQAESKTYVSNDLTTSGY